MSAILDDICAYADRKLQGGTLTFALVCWVRGEAAIPSSVALWTPPASQAEAAVALRTAATVPGGELPETAMARYIEVLRAEEGDCVTLCCDNPDPRSAADYCAIDCNGGWTDFEDRRFYGESMLACLSGAALARQAGIAAND